MPKFVDYATDVADILQSDATSGVVRVVLGDSRDGTGFSANAPMWGIDGFISRPNDPDGDGAAQAFFFNDGNISRIVASRDNRFAEKVGTMDPGDRAIVTNGEARVFIKQKRDAVVLYTVSKPDDASMMIDMSGEDGTVTLACAGSWIKMSNDEIVLGVSGGSTITIDKTGITFDGSRFNCNTGGGHFGLVGTFAPPPPIQSVLAGPSGMAGAPSTKWTVAT